MSNARQFPAFLNMQPIPFSRFVRVSNWMLELLRIGFATVRFSLVCRDRWFGDLKWRIFRFSGRDKANSFTRCRDYFLFGGFFSQLLKGERVVNRLGLCEIFGKNFQAIEKEKNHLWRRFLAAALHRE